MILDVPARRLIVREARPQDRNRIADLLHYEEFVHTHMDWRMPLDWLGHSPFVLAEKHGCVLGVLACPPDPAEVAWVRGFAASAVEPYASIWAALWRAARERLAGMPAVQCVASVGTGKWYEELLESTGFRQVTNVVLLTWENGLYRLPEDARPARIRRMSEADLPAVTAVDAAAFQPLWRYSLDGNRVAVDQSVVATVAETADGRVLGYQISTASPLGGHLARLAVLPETQGQGIGYSLLCDLLKRFQQRGAAQVTVNTQEDNTTSLRLYQKAHFRLTGEKYPIFQFDLPHPD
jgi:ribosomal-protein-alanine N-acetyltransferase